MSKMISNKNVCIFAENFQTKKKETIEKKSNHLSVSRHAAYFPHFPVVCLLPFPSVIITSSSQNCSLADSSLALL